MYLFKKKSAKVGLCLGGGGAMGAYQIGVFKALHETGWYKAITAVSGCSVGALNTIFFLNNKPKLAEYIWCEEVARHLIEAKSKVDFAIIQKSLKVLEKFLLKDVPMHKIDEEKIDAESALLNTDYLKLLLDHWVIEKHYANKKIKVYATATYLAMDKNEYFLLNNRRKEDIIKILLASSAIPSLFPPQEIEGVGMFVDGGVRDNLPLKPLLEEKCSIIVTVPLLERIRVKRTLYPETHFLELIPSKKIGGFLNAINFSPTYIAKMIELGYEESLPKLQAMQHIL